MYFRVPLRHFLTKPIHLLRSMKIQCFRLDHFLLETSVANTDWM